MKKLMTGNEAVARGAYEAGITFAAAYPGTPSTEIMENVALYKDNIIAEWAPNEKTALESAAGASIAGARALSAMKHVGLNVAADCLMTYAMMDPNGALIVVTADDPGMHASQNEQDNRTYAKFARIGMFEPSDSNEARDMIVEAAEVSEALGTIILFRMTTRVCHSKSLVEIDETKTFGKGPKKPYEKHFEKTYVLPAHSKAMRLENEKRLERLEKYSNETPFNYIIWNNKKIGIITSGVGFQYAKEVFGTSASYLKLGFTNPLPMDKICAFAKEVDTLYVVEELDPFIENQLKAAGIPCIGKERIPGIGELNPDIVSKALLGKENKIIDFDKSKLVPRPPMLCAGCPHRGFYTALSKRKNTFVAGDIGCYSLGAAAPLYCGDGCTCMGNATSLAHGAQKAFNYHGENMRTVAVMGDSTFFHTGMNGLLDSLYNHSNVITCILDNRTTGMTGHQENPGTGYTCQGEVSEVVDIETVVRALGCKHIKTVNPNRLDEVNVAFDWAYALDEPCVIITKWPCALKKFSKEDFEQFDLSRKTCEIDQNKCIGCKICMKTGCPALRFNKETQKASIHQIQCIGCEVCSQVCPKEAISKAKKVGVE